MDGCCYFVEDFPGASTGTPVRTFLNATETLQMRQDHFSSSATYMANQLSLTKSLMKLQQYEILSRSKYTLRTNHSFFPCQ